MPLPICSVCGKKMPPHILSIHMAKTHPQAPKEHILEAIKAQKFDWDTAWFCTQCVENVPEILRDYHLHVKHGI